MSKIFVAIAAVAALIGVEAAAPALAADIAVKAPSPAPVAGAYSWTGFYVGANGGGAWGDPGGTLTALSAGLVGLPSSAMPSAYNLKASGGFAGLQAGYNYQFGNYLAGLEADFQNGRIDGTASSSFPGAFPFASSSNSVNSDMDWFATVRGRFGLTFDRTLVYATGGLATARIKDTVVNNFSSPANLFGRTSTTRTGWTAGGGAEYALTDNWILRAEYLYLNVGSDSVTATDPINLPGSFATYSFQHHYNVVRGALDYRF